MEPADTGPQVPQNPADPATPPVDQNPDSLPPINKTPRGEPQGQPAQIHQNPLDAEDKHKPLETESQPLVQSKYQSSKHSRSPSKLSAVDPTFLPNQLEKISNVLTDVLSLTTPAASLVGNIELLYSHVVVMNSEIVDTLPNTAVAPADKNPLHWCGYTWATRKSSPVQKGVAPLIFGPQSIPEFKHQSNPSNPSESGNSASKDENLSLTDLHRLFGQRPSLCSSDLHLLDPVTRNAIRRENILLARSVGLELSEDLNKSISQKDVLLKISDKVWLYLFETGLLADNVAIALDYVNEILTGAASLQRQVNGEKMAGGDITALFNLLSLTRDDKITTAKDGEKLDLELVKSVDARLDVQLEVIYHALVMLNDIAFEGLDPEQIKRGKEPPKYSFSNDKLVSQLVKGLIEVLSTDVIKKAFRDEKSTKLVNRILQLLLSLESDKTITGLHWLDHLPPITMIKEGSQIKSDMMRKAAELNKLIKDFSTGKFSNFPIDYAGSSDSESKKASKFQEEFFRNLNILEGLKLAGKSGSKTLHMRSNTVTRAAVQFNLSGESVAKEKCFWFAVFDFPTYLLWLGILAFGAASKQVALQIGQSIINLIADYCAFSPVVQGQFFKQKTFEMFQTLNRACDFELLHPLTSIFSSSNFIIVSKSPEFFKGLIEFLSEPILAAWQEHEKGETSDLHTIKPAILSMETLRQVLQAISRQPKCRRSRMQIELCIQRLLYPRVNAILKYFSVKELKQILKPDNEHLPTTFDPSLARLSSRLVPSSPSLSPDPLPAPSTPAAPTPYNHHTHLLQPDTKRTSSNPTVAFIQTPVPERFLFAELCLHSLRLLNDGIRFSGGFVFLFQDGHGLKAGPGTSLDSNSAWNHADYDYLRQVPGGYAFLAEIQCYYAHHHLFNRQLEFSLDPLPPKAQDENPSQLRMKYTHSASPNNMSINHDLQRHNSRNQRPDPGPNNWTKLLHRQQVSLLPHCIERTNEIRSMLANTELFARDTGVETPTSGNNSLAVKLQYCVRGPLKILHRYLCGVLVRVPPQEYPTIKMDALIADLKDNFDALVKMLHLDVLPPPTDTLLGEYHDLESVLEAGGKSYKEELNERKLSATDRSNIKYNEEQLRYFRQNQLVLLKIVSLIEALFKRVGFELEIMEVRRETEFELNFTETSSLYAGIGVCENLALSSWMKTVLHIHGENGKNQSLQKLKKNQKLKQSENRFDGESPQEALEKDREFEQVFSQHYSEEDLGLTKGIDELYEEDTEENPDEIKLDATPMPSPQRSASKEPKLETQARQTVPKLPQDQPQTGYQLAKRRLLHEKRIALSEKSCFFEKVDMGSNVSDQAYWMNLIGWIHFVLSDKLSQLQAPTTDLSLLFFDEDFIALLNMLHNFTKQKKAVRKILSTLIKLEPNPKKTSKLQTSQSMRPLDIDAIQTKQLTLDQYLYNSVILLQHALKQAVLGGNLKLELEEFFITSKLISSLMENDCKEFKQRLIDFNLGDGSKLPTTQRTLDNTEPAPVNALGMIYDGLVLNSDITDPNFCTEDRGDLVWYNITCLNLMAECMSGPFEKAQDCLSLHIQQKSSCLRLLRICMRINRNINSSFFDLQESLMEFLAAIFEGVNKKKNTVKELISQPESSPDRIFKMITQHLHNLWNNSDVVIKARITAKSEKPKTQALDVKDPHYFGILIGNMISIGKQEAPSAIKEDPGLENLLDYYTIHPDFSSHPSISIARKLYDIMTFAESIGLRKFTKALQEKRLQMQNLDTDNAGSKVLEVFDNLATGKLFGLGSRQTSTVSQTASLRGAWEAELDANKAGPQVAPSDSVKRDQHRNTMYFKFLMEITGSVEVVVGDKNVCVQFPILPECKFITEEEVELFVRRCSLEDPNTRLFELIDFVDEVLIDKQNDMKFYKIFPPLIYLTRRRTFKLMVLVIWMISAAINVIWIISSDIIDTVGPDEVFERTDTIAIQEKSAQLGIAILSGVIVLCSLLIFVIWLSTRWFNLVNIRELQLKKQKALNSKFTERILKFKAYVIDSLVGQPLPMVLLMHILFVVLYYTVTDFFVCLHLLLFVYHSETTRYIMKSVTKDLKKIGITFLMIIFMVYCYSTIIGYHYADKFKSSFDGVNPCETWLSCLVYTFDYGLRLGGGVGDAMNLLPREDSYFTEKLIINLTFLLLIKLIASNIVLGIIIDTFSELRDSQSTREALLENECFICGIEKNEFEKKEKSFTQHVKQDHKILSYIHFMVYLKSKKSDQISGVELYVRDLFVKQKSTEWYPILNTMFLEGTEASTEDKVVEKLKTLEEALDKIDIRLKSEIKHMCTKFEIKLSKKGNRQNMSDSDDNHEDEDNPRKNSDDDISDKSAFEDFYEGCKEKDFEVLPNYLSRKISESPDDESGAPTRQPTQSRRKLARDLWRLKKEALSKDLKRLDELKNRLSLRIKQEEDNLKEQQSQAASTAEKNKKDIYSKADSPSGLLSSILDKADVLTRIQAR